MPRKNKVITEKTATEMMPPGKVERIQPLAFLDGLAPHVQQRELLVRILGGIDRQTAVLEKVEARIAEIVKI